MNLLIVLAMTPVFFGAGWGVSYLWGRRRRKAALRRRVHSITISPVVPPIFGGSSTGGPVALTVGHLINQQFASLHETPEPLEETWSNEKVEAWRVINVDVEKGDPDGLWLGFPHPDGPTADRFTPGRHPVGVELHAKCDPPVHPWFLTFAEFEALTLCPDPPGERCKSGVGYGCGFYAFKTRDQAVYAANYTLFVGAGVAVARVLLSGKVVEHEAGYRAEILKVVEVEKPMNPAPVLLGDALWPPNPFFAPHIISGGS